VLQHKQTVAIQFRPFIQVFLVGIAHDFIPVVAPFQALIPPPIQAGQSLAVMPEGLVLDVEQSESLVVIEVL
jgi:hypothetical protein